MTPDLPMKAPAMTPTAAEAIAAAWNYDDPAATEAKFRALLASTPAQDPAYRLEVETQLARTFSLRARFDEALRILDGVDKELVSRDLPRVKVRALLERGRCHNSDKRPAEAMPFFMRAWEVAKAAKLHNLAVDAAHMVAIAAPDAAGSEKWNREAIAYAKASGDADAQKWLGSLLNNLAWTKHDAGDPAAALVLFEECLAWHRARKTGSGEFIARYAVARCQRTLGRYAEALGAQQALQADMALAGEPEDGYVSEEIAEDLLALGLGGEAKAHFRKAHELLKGDVWLARNEPKRLERLAELGRE